MALTEEQLKNLKPGDIIDIRGFVNLPLCNGNILVELRYEFDHRTLPAYQRISTEFISLPPEQPKHDPCRLFKEGDIVKRRTVDGRTDPDVPEGINLTVTTGEAKYGNVRVQEPNGRSIVTKAVFLELITPVEELEPYRIGKSDYNGFVNIEKKGKIIAMIPYGKELHEHKTEEQALATAEAERDRLNAEHRKEHGND